MIMNSTYGLTQQQTAITPRKQVLPETYPCQ